MLDFKKLALICYALSFVVDEKETKEIIEEIAELQKEKVLCLN